MWKYVALLIRPTMIGAIAAFLWYLFRDSIGIDPADKEVYQWWPILPSAVHGVLIGLFVYKVTSQNQRLLQAKALENWKQFKENECLRIHKIIKGVFALFSFIFFVVFLLYPFASAKTGIVFTWLTMFILYLMWEVATELDDPYNGIWKITHEEVLELFSSQMNEKEIATRRALIQKEISKLKRNKKNPE